MPTAFPSAVPHNHLRPTELRWSKSEWTTVRKAFDRALNQELQEVIQQAKPMAAAIKQPSELRKLECHLTQRRKEIDYSVQTT